MSTRFRTAWTTDGRAHRYDTEAGTTICGLTNDLNLDRTSWVRVQRRLSVASGSTVRAIDIRPDHPDLGRVEAPTDTRNQVRPRRSPR
jgi:hypothetical protein